METRTDNVILITDHGKPIGFINHARVYKCEPMNSEEIARLIDPEFDTIARKAAKEAHV